MNAYRRPWWLLMSWPAGLTTTIYDENRPGERILTVHGEPAVQGLAWLTWGPVGALLVIFLLTGMAMAWQINQQSWTVRGFFILAFLSLPALVWVAVALVFKQLAVKHVQAARQAGTAECVIRLNQAEGLLVYQIKGQSGPHTVPYGDIRRVRVAPAVEVRGSEAWRLVLDTDARPIVLLDEKLGTHPQKIDLAAEIQHTIDAYA